MLNLLIDTSTWLDLGKKRDGQKTIQVMNQLVSDDELRILVPPVVVEEFARNRPRIETSITTSLADRIKSLRREVKEYGGDAHAGTQDALDELAHHAPLIGAMTTRNFDDIEALLRAGKRVRATARNRTSVVQRGLDKRAPFHRTKNSVADALIIEGYASTVASADLSTDPHWFITTNHDDFSSATGDRRHPHPDIAEMFSADGSNYGLGVDGLSAALEDHFGEDYLFELYSDYDFQEDPRRLDELLTAENELFDRIWYHRSLQHDISLRADSKTAELKQHQKIARTGRRRVEAKFAEQDVLGPYTDFELGMLNGKLSAIRWVLGSEWDFLDT